ncbi:Uncharacterized protein APZ42_034533 [Daphnia magna]|uniref:Uncharacterized protein n=1 Tax=Daphnia magna TaxID=35525 RepID=A0A164K1Y2_9CRUS|nr:Uncharacterized protein APZ42_034533 [Daphnia magna]
MAQGSTVLTKVKSVSCVLKNVFHVLKYYVTIELCKWAFSRSKKKKYIDKLDIFQCDCPYSLSKDLWKQELQCCTIIPKIDHGDIFAYLVFSRSNLDVEKTKRAYKGLKAESKQAVNDGWLKQFMAMCLSSGVVLVQAKVTPSQAINDTPHSPWAAIGVDGCVIYAQIRRSL